MISMIHEIEDGERSMRPENMTELRDLDRVTYRSEALRGNADEVA